MKNSLKIAGFIGVLLLSGCSQVNLQQNSTNNDKPVVKQECSEPKWLDDPYIDGDKIAAVACAKRHMSGKSAQKKLAIQRARDEIAACISTEVSSMTVNQSSVSNSARTSSSSQKTSMHKVDSVNVATKVKDIYEKPNGEICAWVVQN